MGFSSALQGKSAHDALLSRQDAELRLLEIMKRCLLQKVKCDKEYAIALTAAAQHGLKIDRADDLQGKYNITLFVTFPSLLLQFTTLTFTLHTCILSVFSFWKRLIPNHSRKKTILIDSTSLIQFTDPTFWRIRSENLCFSYKIAAKTGLFHAITLLQYI